MGSAKEVPKGGQKNPPQNPTGSLRAAVNNRGTESELEFVVRTTRYLFIDEIT